MVVRLASLGVLTVHSSSPSITNFSSYSFPNRLKRREREHLTRFCLLFCRRGKVCPGGKEQGTSDNENDATDTSSFQSGAQFQFSGICCVKSWLEQPCQESVWGDWLIPLHSWIKVLSSTETLIFNFPGQRKAWDQKDQRQQLIYLVLPHAQ